MASQEYLAHYRKVLFEVMDKYPDAPSRTLARILNRDYPELWPTIECARTIIRRYRGKLGAINLKELGVKKYVKV